LEKLLQIQNAQIDAIAYCPHYHQSCDCRKPKPGMILALAQKFQVDINISWMIGDRETDILAGTSAGCRTIKISKRDVVADFYCDNLNEAVNLILGGKPSSN
jgi:HAD-superfamily hydrolase, subfamily IIIA